MPDDASSSAPVPRIFLSYAREDDEAFVRRLYNDLTAANLTVWFDRESLLSRGKTFHQEIKDAIRTEVDRVVYVGGPKAAASSYVQEEWRFALECDHVVVTPILRLGEFSNIPGELALLHCEDFRNDAKYSAALAKLIVGLREPNPRLGALYAVPSLPPHFLGRPELMCRVRDALLVDLQKPQVITSADARVGMQGMGGIGKSVLAAALARTLQVRQSYPDGVVWIACGQHLNREDLLQRQRDLARHLGVETNFDSLPQGHGVLREALAKRAVLIVLDDVWQAADAQPFDVLGPRCRMLITTRNAGILHSLDGELVPVSLFTEIEALQLLADAVGIERTVLPTEAREIVKECGCLPLAVALSGGMAKKRGGDFCSVLERLRRADLDKIADRESINEQHRSIWRAMQASVEVLSAEEQRRFAELAVFDTNGTVPESAAATFWAHTGGLDDLDAEDLLLNFAERSLVQLDTKPDTAGARQRRFRLHDLLHDYAVRIVGDGTALHRALIEAYRKKCPDGWSTGPNDGYFFETLVAHHVHGASQSVGPCFGREHSEDAFSAAETLVTDFRWLMRKCELGLLASITQDYAFLDAEAPTSISQRLKIWRAFFREKAHIIRRGSAEWSAHKILLQLAVEHADGSPLTIGAEKFLAESRCNWLWLRRNRRLPHAQISPCLAVLEGHSRSVYGAQVLSDGRILSWSGDSTLRLWEASTGKALAVLEGHLDSVHGALSLPDGRILSWSTDKTLRLWEASTGKALAVLEGHSESVYGARVLPDGRILSWSNDKTLRLWESSTGKTFAVLEGHSESVSDTRVLPDGRILSWSNDKTVRLWDSSTGKALAVLEGHSEWVEGALELPDGRILSWSRDKTLRLWDDSSGRAPVVLEGHSGWVTGALVLPDDRILSWSEDNTLRLWDASSGEVVAVLEGHSDSICDALVLPDGRVLSWSGDNSLRVWDASSGKVEVVLEGHSNSVFSAHVLSDGRILSWSWDRTLRIWDASSGKALAVLEGHMDYIFGALALPGGRILSWSGDGTLRLWDASFGKSLVVLEGHSDEVEGTLALPDCRIVSWSRDKTLRIWDASSGKSQAILEGHSGWVRSALALSNGRILSQANDNNLRLWDASSGKGVVILEGHSEYVRGALALPNGRILSWSNDKTLRLWDSGNGQVLAVLEGHSGMVWGALELLNDRILSWSVDNLRLWDASSGNALLVLEGHTGGVSDARVLPDGHILSWAHDNTMCLWDVTTGRTRVVFEGHTEVVRDILVLPTGRILSWSNDNTLRLWDSCTGKALVVFEGHTEVAYDVLGLPDGRVLSWSFDDTLRLWDLGSGRCLEVIPEAEVAKKHPEWLHARAQTRFNESVVSNLFARSRILLAKTRTAQLRHKVLSTQLADWQAESVVEAHQLQADGTLVVTQENGQVCFLQLHHGNRRISLAEAEKLSTSAQFNLGGGATEVLW